MVVKQLTVQEAWTLSVTNANKKYAIESLSKYLYCRQVVTRLFTIEEIESVLKTSPWDFVATVETTPNFHIHILLFSEENEIKIEKVREFLKKGYETLGKPETAYKNGQLNIMQKYQEDFFVSITYIVKSHASIYYQECYKGIEYPVMTTAKKYSFEKYPDIPTLVKKLFKAVRAHEIKVHEALKEYHWIRNRTDKIDSNLIAMYRKFETIANMRTREESDHTIDCLIENISNPEWN